MRVFIFGIGGTGARVLRSLTMLLASGVKINQQALTLIPIVIDTDAHNGDTARTRDLLRSYYAIRKTFVNKTMNQDDGGFFNTEIRSFKRLSEESEDGTDLDVQFNFQTQDNTFANFINYSALSKSNKDIIELFYNDSVDAFQELYLNLSVGFKGNPNIGSVVFNDLKYAEQFKNLEASFTSNDRVFIISSIFGGTGSAGFPTLVKLIRTSTNNNLAKTKIGAVTVMPYFNVEVNEKSAINSSIFDTKTKAALSFYSSDTHINSINALYYIADNNLPGNLANVEGGVDQKNNAHVIELLAATSIVDYINTDDASLETPRCFEFGAERNGLPLGIADFVEASKNKYIAPLVRFAYAAQIATQFIPVLKEETFYKTQELDIANAMGVKGQYDRLLDFFNEYKEWSTKEMNSQNNGRAFNSFSFTAQNHLNNLVQGRSIQASFFNKGLSINNVAAWLSKTEVKLSEDMPKPEKYLVMLYRTAEKCLKELGELP